MDEIDVANETAELLLKAQISKKKHSGLLPAGACHYCDELLPKIGQLFCNRDCSEDYESEQRMRHRAGLRDE